jgi:hypothetical protein
MDKRPPKISQSARRFPTALPIPRPGRQKSDGAIKSGGVGNHAARDSSLQGATLARHHRALELHRRGQGFFRRLRLRACRYRFSATVHAPRAAGVQLGNQGILSRGGGGGRANGGAGCANGATWTNGCGGGATRSKTFIGFGFKVGGGSFEKRECFAGG